MKRRIERTRLPAALPGALAAAGLCLTLALGASPAALAQEAASVDAQFFIDDSFSFMLPPCVSGTRRCAGRQGD